MEKSGEFGKIKILLVIFLILILAVIIFLSVRYFSKSPPQVCTKPSLSFQACYNSIADSLIVTLSRQQDNVNIKEISIILDSSTHFTLSSIPKTNQVKKYLLSYPNTKSIQVLSILNSVKNCSYSETVQVSECEKNATSISITTDSGVSEGQIYSERVPSFLPKELFTEKEVLKLGCQSVWKCSDWDECVDGVQRRDCFDANKCPIQTSAPQFAKNCETCQEYWLCSWSKCASNYTLASCRDLNKCGTNYSEPSRLPCKVKKDCEPNITCQEWSECKVTYSLAEISKGVEFIHGTKSRKCTDKNGCVADIYDYSYCPDASSISTKKVNVCGKDYLEAYDTITGSVIARIDDSEKLNIDLFLTDSSPCK